MTGYFRESKIQDGHHHRKEETGNFNKIKKARNRAEFQIEQKLDKMLETS
jgi:hypothetical protein